MSAQFCPASCPLKLLDHDEFGSERSKLVVIDSHILARDSREKPASTFSHPALARKPEGLVVTGLRCCMAGYAYGDIECWETAWRSYAMELGTDDARRLMGELQYWVRTLRAESVRPLAVFPYGCSHVCRDECMALSSIAALQDHDRPTALLAARHLAGAAAGDAPLTVAASGESFAEALAAAGQKLSSVPATVIHSIAAFGSGPAAAVETLH